MKKMGHSLEFSRIYSQLSQKFKSWGNEQNSRKSWDSFVLQMCAEILEHGSPGKLGIVKTREIPGKAGKMRKIPGKYGIRKGWNL